MNIIRKLPLSLSNQISAGEVIERPANILKELLENSLDAGADSIYIEIEQGGLQRVYIQDNGVGIEAQSLPLALERYATSKLETFSDLYSLNTFGFRGEALASIASISEVTLTSALLQEDGTRAETHYIYTRYGIQEKEGQAIPIDGTSIAIENIFLTTPARLKFLKSPLVEQKKCSEIVIKIALANLHVGFTLLAGGRELFSLSKNQTLAERLSELWAPAISTQLMAFSGTSNDIAISGMASSSSITQKRADKIITYVNKRPVHDKILLRAIRESYANIITSKEYPQVVLFLELPPADIDVNVHPAKTEIRFRDESTVIRSIVAILGKKVRSESQNNSISSQEHIITKIQQEHETPLQTGISWETFIQQPIVRHHTIEEDVPSTVQYYPPYTKTDTTPTETLATQTPNMPINTTCILADVQQPRPSYTFISVCYETYLLYQNTIDGTILILDQHAAHERILEETLCRNTKNNSQYLTVPFIIPIHHTLEERVQHLWDNMHEIGFILQQHQGSMSIIAIPSILHPSKAKQCLEEILHGSSDDISEYIHKKACTSAIKSGDILSTEDAYSLLQKWLDTQNNTHCPHGRPIAITLTLSVLEKLFKRTV